MQVRLSRLEDFQREALAGRTPGGQGLWRVGSISRRLLTPCDDTSRFRDAQTPPRDATAMDSVWQQQQQQSNRACWLQHTNTHCGVQLLPVLQYVPCPHYGQGISGGPPDVGPDCDW